MEIACDQVLGCFADFAFVGAVFALGGTLGYESLLFHDPANDLLRHNNLIQSEGCVHPAIPVAPVAFMEYLRYADAQISVLVRL